MERARTIMVVAANQGSAFSKETVLERAGYSVVKALGPEAALCLIEAPTYIDLILMDVDLEDSLDGIDAARILQFEHRVPIVFSCAERTESLRQRLELVNSYGLVEADAGEASLLATVAIAFQRQRAERLAREDSLRSMMRAPAAGERVAAFAS